MTDWLRQALDDARERVEGWPEAQRAAMRVGEYADAEVEAGFVQVVASYGKAAWIMERIKGLRTVHYVEMKIGDGDWVEITASLGTEVYANAWMDSLEFHTYDSDEGASEYKFRVACIRDTWKAK